MFGLAFGAPFILLALLVLPAIYFLLRVTPPAPQRIVFPPLQFLLGLRSKEETPARTPLWLLILRLIAAALVIVALAEPRFDSAPSFAGSGPLVLFVDNDWAAASHWFERTTAMDRALANAGSAGRSVVLIGTADANADAPRLIDAERAKKLAADMAPRSWAPDRARAAKLLGEMEFPAKPQILWLSDGIDHGDAKSIAETLNKIGALTVFGDSGDDAPLALRPPENTPTGFDISVARLPDASARAARVVAVDARGRTLESADIRFTGNSAEAKASLALPLDIRNDAARISILGENSAGAVQLLDASFRRRAVGLVSGGAADVEQPLLSDSFYIERALAPYAEVRRGTIAQTLASGISVLVLADVGQLTSEERTGIESFLNDGGVLLRFAGPRLAEHATELSDNAVSQGLPGAEADDDLIPVRLRAGERQLGGALVWAQPQMLAPFADTSPFAGLKIPDDVTVTRQVLAEPSIDLSEHSWARLSDGTPLVTASAKGHGWVVLFHTAATPGWSSLPISGLFVDMLRRVIALSEGVRGNGAAVTAQSYPAYRLLDGYGRLASPSPDITPLKASELDSVPSATHPAGLYGNEGGFVALNTIARGQVLQPLDIGLAIAAYAGGAVSDLEWPLLLAALMLLLADALIGLYLRGFVPVSRWRQWLARAAPIALVLLWQPFIASNVHADDAKNAAAALSTRLGYVITGDPSVDAMSRDGLYGLGRQLAARTSYEPQDPIGVNIETDDLALYPLLYWPMTPAQKDLSPKATARINQFMRNGGTILFDTRDAPLSGLAAATTPGETTLRRLLSHLDIPPLEPVPNDHVLTKSFYILREFPGRWSGGQVWVEALPPQSLAERSRGRSLPVPARGGDGVSPVIIGGNDWASAWATDKSDRPLAAVTPGGDAQREMAYRFGVNTVMYALTGNYKTDQVHAPALIERLGE